MAAQGTILIADDTDVNRAILSAILRSAGFEVVQAKDGVEALEELRRSPPDVVLLDVVMPELDGFGVLAAIRGDPAIADLPVIFLTSKGETADKVRGLEAGAADYVTKPFDAEEVLARVRTQVRLRQLTRSLGEANAALRERQALLDEDLRAAADIQRALLPRGPLGLPGLKATSFFLPSFHVGGDIFSLQRLDAHHVAAWILDVSGHGVGAAMVTVSVAQRLSPYGGITVEGAGEASARPVEPGQVLARLDEEYPIERFDRFFTIAYALLDLRDGRLRYSCAGHPASLLLRKDGAVEELAEGGTLVGLGTGRFPQAELRLAPGDRLLLYTDGLTDYQGKADARFGAERLRKAAQGLQGKPFEQGLDALLRGVIAHGEGAPADDDVTLLALEWSGPPPQRVRFAFDSRLDEVRAAAGRLREHWMACGVAAGDADALEIAFVEAANNAVLHAYGGQAGHRIAAESDVFADRVEVRVDHRGSPAPEGALEPRLQADDTEVRDLAEGGRGGLLLRSLADHVEARSGAEGSSLHIVRLRRQH